MEELKTFTEWEAVVLKDHGLKLISRIGFRKLCEEGRELDLLALDEFERYFIGHDYISVKFQ